MSKRFHDPNYGVNNAFSQRFPGRTWPLMCGLILMIGIWITAILTFNKLAADWLGISIFVPGIVLIMLVCVILGVRGHFSADSTDRLPSWVLWTVLVYTFRKIIIGKI